LVDGDEVATATLTAAGADGGAEIGIWSQGVRLGLRRVAVLPLDSAEA
jgi:hypothetical protein